MDANTGWRTRYLRRRRLRLVVLSVIAVALVLALAQSCGPWSASPGASYSALSSDARDASGSSGSSGSSGTGGGAGSAGDTGSEGSAAGEADGADGSGDGSGDSGSSGDKPYEAIPPPEGAEPLRDRSESGTGARRGEETSGGDVPAGRMLVKGAEDNSNGPLQNNRLVAYYGTPLSGYMGILGELTPEQMMRQLKEQTRAYSAADPERPAIPTIELIASVAQRNPGPDGLYVKPTPEEEIRRYSKLAKENDALLLLDVQIGRDSLMNEVRRLEPFLKQPHVHLAIDTEYSVGPGEVPGVDLGTVAGSDIQRAVRYMHGLAEKEGVPDKVVLVHQFETGIVTGKQNIEPTSNVEVVLNADGFGRAAGKLSKYEILVSQQPIQYGGFKVFYRQDYPVLSPEEVLQLDPAPAVVNYQ